ncbi:MAG: class I SAM-dependent methyltransferase [Alphaproteobacteria bacterium]
MKTNENFWDRVADKYAASPIKNMAAYERTLARTRSYLSTEQDVLEVGCGTGSTALILAPDVRDMTATDISRRMIEIGEGKARDQEVKNVTFRQAALPDATLAPESYDAILCFNTLHLVTDLPAVLRNLHGALKPGGVFISKTVCLAQQTRLWAIPIFLMRLVGKAPYVNMLTFDAIERAIAAEGFEIVETGTDPAPSAGS